MLNDDQKIDCKYMVAFIYPDSGCHSLYRYIILRLKRDYETSGNMSGWDNMSFIRWIPLWCFVIRNVETPYTIGGT